MRLQRAAVREAVLQDQLILSFESELEAVLRRADREIQRLVRQLAQERGRFVRTRAALGRVVRLRKDIQTALFQTAGVHDLAERAVNARFDRITTMVLEDTTIAGRAFTLTKTDLSALTAFKELRLADLLEWGQGLAHQVHRITVDGVLGLRPVDDLVADLGRVLDLSVRRARTIYDTSVSMYSRQVGLLHTSGKPDELFYYAGPLDSVTRPFCRVRIGKVFSRADVDAMDNGQIPDPLVSGGGYNCRHAFKRVSMLDEELRELHRTGGRLPHVAEQLARLKRVSSRVPRRPR